MPTLRATLAALAWLLSVHVRRASADREIRYWFEPDQKEYVCVDGDTRNPCGKGSYGGCASNTDSSVPLLWCCMAENPICWGWGQDCSEKGRKICRSGGASWCCDAELEDCDTKAEICILKKSVLPGPLEDYAYPSPDGLTAWESTTTIFVAGSEETRTAQTTGTESHSRLTVTVAKSSSTAGVVGGGGPTGSATSTGESASSTASATDTPTPDEDKDEGLSAGAAAGIGVGVTLLVLVGGAALFFMLTRRRRQRVLTNTTPMPEMDSGLPHQHYHDNGMYPVSPSVGVASAWSPQPPPSELGTFGPSYELGGGQGVASELPAHQGYYDPVKTEGGYKEEMGVRVGEEPQGVTPGRGETVSPLLPENETAGYGQRGGHAA